MIRLTPVALYASFQEVYETVQVLKKVMDGNLYENYENKRGIIAWNGSNIWRKISFNVNYHRIKSL